MRAHERSPGWCAAAVARRDDRGADSAGAPCRSRRTPGCRRRRSRASSSSTDPPRRRRARGAGSPPPATELHLVGGSVRDALLRVRPVRRADRPRLHHRCPARAGARACCAAGPSPRGTPASRSAPSAPRRHGMTVEITTFRADALRPREPQPGRRLRRRRWSTTWSAATSRSTRWRSSSRVADTGRDRPVTAGSPLWPPACCDTPGHAGGVVRRRPAADAARGPVRRPAAVSRRRRAWSRR